MGIHKELSVYNKIYGVTFYYILYKYLSRYWVTKKKKKHV